MGREDWNRVTPWIASDGYSHCVTTVRSGEAALIVGAGGSSKGREYT